MPRSESQNTPNNGLIASPVEMPENVAIRAESLGKCYRLFSCTRQRLLHAVTGRWREVGEAFWAARDVSFEIQRGESVAFVGPNGSGKSTVLGMIAGTITPTEGRVAVRGRVAALLQLGAGFDNEFTGRENAYMNGAILGLTREEMDERFDDIEAFADIGTFMDQPVRTYSSGMRARLAFSVATSVSPDVLIVDEALSVGDNAFQQKCVARVKKLVDSGLTFLFVSHAMGQVKGMCRSSLYLSEGRKVFFGPSAEAVELYLSSTRDANGRPRGSVGAREARAAVLDERLGSSLRYGSGQLRITDVTLTDEYGRATPALVCGEKAVVSVSFECVEPVPAACVGVAIRDHAGIDLFCTTTFDEGAKIGPLKNGETVIARFCFPVPFRHGRYALTAYLAKPGARAPNTNEMPFDYADACLAFEIIAKDGRPVFHRVHVETEVSVKMDSPLPSPTAASSGGTAS